MKIALPKDVQVILRTLQKNGYEAYAVGGCVRDSILGRIPDDWDITTSAKPEQIKACFEKTVDTGIQHGTITVILHGEGYEVTTYRIDGEYEDNRHPKSVQFTASLKEDLMRRDFTINAMAYNDEVGLVDYYEGIEDIQKKIIRAVGDPICRFTEDALRIMRAVRFCAQLGYTMEEKTMEGVRALAPNLAHISAERIQVELTKLLCSPHPDYLRLAIEGGITKVVLPELDLAMETEQHNPHHCYTVGEHILHSLLYVPADKVLRYTMLFHDLGKPETKTRDEAGKDHFYGHCDKSESLSKQIFKRLKMDNDTIYQVTKLVKYHDLDMALTPYGVRKAIVKMGEDLFPKLLLVKEADLKAQSEYQYKEKWEKLETIKSLYQEILERKDCVSLKTLAVSGNDLLEIGIPQGKEMGKILQDLFQQVLVKPELNSKEILLKMVQKKNQF